MTSRGATLLTLHGLAVLFLGLLAGAPYGAAIVGGWGDEPVRAWKLAHMEGVQNGILLVALAGVGRFLRLGARAESVVVWGASLAAWGNVLGAALGAVTGYRGLAPEGPLANWLVFVAFMFGMWGVLIAVPVAAWGAVAALRAPSAADSGPARRAASR
jgi:hypothetical protein